MTGVCELGTVWRVVNCLIVLLPKIVSETIVTVAQISTQQYILKLDSIIVIMDKVSNFCDWNVRHLIFFPRRA